MALTAAAPANADGSIVRDPAEVPAPIARSEPATLKVELETVERVAELNDGSTCRFWTFNGQVPGQMLRARVLAPRVEVERSNVDRHDMTKLFRIE